MSLDKSFSTSKNKINQLWDSVENIKNFLNLTDTELKKFYNENQNFKVPFLLAAKDVVTTLENTPYSFTGSTTVQNGTVLASPALIFQPYIDFYCPASFLPFLQCKKVYQLPTGFDVVPFSEYNTSTWSGNLVDVRGDTDLIWHGVKPVGNPPQFTQTDLDLGRFQANHAKKIYTITIVWTDTGGQWRIRPSTLTLNNSHISTIDIDYDRVSSGITRLFDSAIEYNYKELLMNRDALATSLHTILGLDTTTLNLIGTYTQHTFANNNVVDTTSSFTGTIKNLAHDIISVNSVTVNSTPVSYTVTGNKQITLSSSVGTPSTLVVDYQAAVETISSSNNTEITTLWTDVYSYSISLTESILEKWNGSTYVQQGAISGHTVNSTTSGFSLISRSFSSGLRYSVYYDTDTRFIFAMDAFGALINPPYSQGTYPVSFTTIYVKKNVDEAAPTATPHDGFAHVSSQNLDRHQPIFLLLKENPTTQINLYRYIFDTDQDLISTKATVAGTDSWESWDDTYTLSGSAFALNTTSHGTITTTRYGFESIDVPINFQIWLVHPFTYFKHMNVG